MNLEEFMEPLAFSEQYNDEKYSTMMYITSDKSCLMAISDKSNTLIDGAIVYHDGTKWVVLNNRASYLAVNSYINYLMYCGEAFATQEDQDELGGIEI